MLPPFLRRTATAHFAVLALGVVVGLLARELITPTRGEAGAKTKGDQPVSRPRTGSHLAPDTAAAYDPDWERRYPQYQPVGKVLKPMPDLKPGERCPQDVSIYGGAGRTSYGSIDDVAEFAEFCHMCLENKPRVMEERRDIWRSATTGAPS